MTEMHQEIEREDSGPSNVQNPKRNLVDEVRLTILSLGPPLSSECCIHRVPKKLRDINPAAYTPQVVSVGPFHHGQEALRKMETEKSRYLEHFLAKAEPAVSLDDLMSYIREKETRIRECYAESIDYLSSDAFVKMVLVDAAFIIMLFMWARGEKEPDDDDDEYLIFNAPRMIEDLFQELILLENQLPFFILKDLYGLAFSSYQEQGKHVPFADVTLDFFGHFNQQDKEFPEDTKHFTDLLRNFNLPLPSSTHTSSPTYFSNCCNHYRSFPGIQPLTSFLPLNRKLGNENEDREILEQGELHKELLYCAVELHAAGVEFEVSQSKCLLDVQFTNGKLVMPSFRLEDSTEIVIRNIMAFEQCHCLKEAKICNYIFLMDYLINTAKDVELLIQKKILVNWLGNNQEAADLINKLGSQITEYENRYRYLFKELNEYYEVAFHRWKATLRQEYCNTPFKAASTFAAIILLVLTLLQFVFARIKM